MSRRFVGVDLGTHRVKLCEASASLRGVQVSSAWEEAVEIGPEGGADLDAAVAMALAMIQDRGLGGESIVVSLPGNLASYRLLEFPFSDARRIAQAVAFEVDGQFPVPLEELAFDHVPVRGPKDTGRALVLAVRKARVQAALRPFEDAGVRVRGVTVAPLALAQVLEPSVVPLPETEGAAEPGARVPVTLVVDMGHRSTEMLAFTDDGPVAARSVRVGGREVTLALAAEYGMSPVEAERAKLRDGFVPHRGMGTLTPEQQRAGAAMVRGLEGFVREVQHTRLWLRTRHGYEATRLVLAGGGAELHGLDLYLAEQLGLDVQPISEAPLVGVREDGEIDRATFAVAMGAAVGAIRGPLVHLHESATGADGASWLQQRMPVLMSLALAIMGFGAIDTIVQVQALDSESKARADELAALSQDVLGESITSPSEITSRLEAVRGGGLRNKLPQRGALDVLDMITRAATPAGKPPPPAQPAGVPGVPLDETGAPDSTALATGAAPTGASAVPGAPAGGAEAGAPAPVLDPSQGVVWDDELVLSMVDIRERKVELKASATRSSTQDRLALKLEQTGCLKHISKGKVRDQNERKVFEMSMDNMCTIPEDEQEGADADKKEGA